mmetsp:Transcript_46713/g.150092  ORF Transcript_46713/g.150092 Transcript_46713/m.150092 type:complete len:217 (-) Transcript_46713:1350-2000(-)
MVILERISRVRVPRWDVVVLVARRGRHDRSLLSQRDLDGFTPFILCAQNDNCQLMEWMYFKGVSVEEQDNLGRTALHWAAYRGNRKTVQWLLSRSASIVHRDHEGTTAVHWAALKNKYQLPICSSTSAACTCLISRTAWGRHRSCWRSAPRTRTLWRVSSRRKCFSFSSAGRIYRGTTTPTSSSASCWSLYPFGPSWLRQASLLFIRTSSLHGLPW